MWSERTGYGHSTVRQIRLTAKPRKLPIWPVTGPVYHMVGYQEDLPSAGTIEMLMYYTVSLCQGNFFAHVSFSSLVVFLAQLISKDTSANSTVERFSIL